MVVDAKLLPGTNDLVARIAAESSVQPKVEYICSLVAFATFVEIRYTAFYESACHHNNQSIQRRRFLGDFAISVILRHDPY